MITKKQLEEAFPGDDVDGAWRALKKYDKLDREDFKDFALESKIPYATYLREKEELLLELLNSILRCFGVEYIPRKEDTQHETLGISYLNLGDTYISTVIYDHKEDKWMICSWGDIIEEKPEDFE
jgi:hypothetical protein